jgi:SAM-dependent methyltransferase
MRRDFTHDELQNLKVFSSKEAVEVYEGFNLFRVEKSIIDNYFTKAVTVLDIGCGAGRTTIPLFQMGFDVIGIDISSAMIAAAKARAPKVDFRVGDACALDFPDNSFDAVLFSWNGIDCIVPVSRRIRALNEINRILKPKGIFVFSSLNTWCLANIVNREGAKELVRLVYAALVRPSIRPPRRIIGKNVTIDAGCGEVIVCRRNPLSQKRQLRRCGFKLLSMYAHGTAANPSFNYNSKLKYFDAWPCYVAQKVKASAE